MPAAMIGIRRASLGKCRLPASGGQETDRVVHSTIPRRPGIGLHFDPLTGKGGCQCDTFEDVKTQPTSGGS